MHPPAVSELTPFLQDEEVTSEVKLGEIKEILANAKEVATTLLYTDGSTQLRRKPVST